MRSCPRSSHRSRFPTWRPEWATLSNLSARSVSHPFHMQRYVLFLSPFSSGLKVNIPGGRVWTWNGVIRVVHKAPDELQEHLGDKHRPSLLCPGGCHPLHQGLLDVGEVRGLEDVDQHPLPAVGLVAEEGPTDGHLVVPGQGPPDLDDPPDFGQNLAWVPGLVLYGLVVALLAVLQSAVVRVGLADVELLQTGLSLPVGLDDSLEDAPVSQGVDAAQQGTKYWWFFLSIALASDSSLRAFSSGRALASSFMTLVSSLPSTSLRMVRERGGRIFPLPYVFEPPVHEVVLVLVGSL